jgi:hypothetical protein
MVFLQQAVENVEGIALFGSLAFPGNERNSIGAAFHDQEGAGANEGISAPSLWVHAAVQEEAVLLVLEQVEGYWWFQAGGDFGD